VVFHVKQYRRELVQMDMYALRCTYIFGFNWACSSL